MSRFYLITGLPGVGKYTVGTALRDRIERRGEVARLVDNHWIANPIFGLVEHDGLNPLPSGVWPYVRAVADAVGGALEEVTPQHWQIIVTFHLDPSGDRDTVEWLAGIAAARNNLFVPVVLVCEVAEHERRIVQAERRLRMKSVDSDLPHRLVAAGEPIRPDHLNTFTLDTTEVSPAEAAARIEAHADALSAP